MPKIKTKDSRQGSLFENDAYQQPQFMFDPDLKYEADRVDAAADFIIERHKIYLRRAAGRPKPWTDDPILRAGKFTNIYRELDPGTVWIVDNIIKPYEQHEDLWFMLCIARLINWPPTLQRMMDEGVWPVKKWKTDKVFQVLKAYQKSGNKLVTGAYIVNSVFPASFPKQEGSKAEYIPYVGLAPLWESRAEIRAAFHTDMATAMTTLGRFHGWGPFLSNQVLVDLSYSKRWLGNAKDLNTFTSPGPGTTKGMNWMISGQQGDAIRGSKLNQHMIKFRFLVNKAVKSKVHPKLWTDDFRTGFAEISMPNYSNCNCELSKMIRSIRDGGTARMKNRYNGG